MIPKMHKFTVNGFEMYAVAVFFDMETGKVTDVHGDFEGNEGDIWELAAQDIEWK